MQDDSAGNDVSRMMMGKKRSSGRSLFLTLMITTAMIGVPTLADHAFAQATSGSATKISFSIRSQPLGQALVQFSNATGVQLFFNADLARGISSQGAQGPLTRTEALSRILAGSGLSYKFTNANTITIQKPADDSSAAVAVPGAIVLDTINVQGGGNYPGDPYAGIINPAMTIGSKEPLSQREIPQSVSVIAQDQIKQQNLQTLDDAMRYAPGVTVNLINPADTAYYSRGFPIGTFQLDGVPTAIPAGGGGTIADNLAMYDRVEVLRGPAGLLNGFGGDGGVINLVRKYAPSQFQGAVEVSGGTYDTARAQFDIGGPLNAAGTVRGRLVALQSYQHLMQDTTWQRDQQFYGTLEADLTPTTTARVGASHTDTSGKLMYGLPGYSDYTLLDIPRSTYLGADWNHLSNVRTNAFAEVEQRLGDDWKAKLSYNYLRIDTHYLNGIPGGPIDPITNIGNPYSYNYQSHDEQHAVDLYATGPFSLFNRVGQLTFGANYLQEYTHNTQYFINPATGLDEWGDYFTDVFTSNDLYSNDFSGGAQNDNHTNTQQFGLYGNVRYKIAEPLTLVAGGRLTWWQAKITPNSNPYYNYFGTREADTKIGPKFSPILGIIYDIDNTYSVYGSYTSIFKPQNGFYTVGGTLIAPVEGEQYEVGVKGEYLDGKVNASIALFQIDESNRAFSDPRYPGFYIAQGKARSQGIELQVNGEILPGWMVSAGYTYQRVRDLDDSVTVGSPFSMTSPTHLFKLATNYQLPGEWDKWSVGAAAYATSSTAYSDGIGSWKAPGYVTVDAHIDYKINENVTASVNATHIFNKKYYQSVAGAGGNYYGNPRTIMATLRTTF